MGAVDRQENLTSNVTYMSSVEEIDDFLREIMLYLREDIMNASEKFAPEASSDEILSLVDSNFREAMKGVFVEILEKRTSSKFPKKSASCGGVLRKDSCILMVYEFFRTLVLHRNHIRNDGTSYFYDHLLGAVKVLLLAGFTGLTSVIGTLKHDDIEDCGVREEDLVRPDIYAHRFERADQAEFCKIKDRVIRIVKGATKVKGAGIEVLQHEIGVPFEDKAEATFFVLISKMQEEIRAVMAKLSDRAQNMGTLSGHPKKEKREAIACETKDVYLPFARLLKIRSIEDIYVDECAKELNPDLYESFYAFRQKRLSRLTSGIKRKITDIVIAFVYDSKVSFVPFNLAHFVKSAQRSLDRVSFEELNIGINNPMQEILVIVPTKDMVNFAVRNIIDAFDFEESSIIDKSKVKGIPDKVLMLDDDGDPATDEFDVPLERDGADVSVPSEVVQISSFVPVGVVVKGFSREYGGQLVFRVNDAVSEERSERGIFADVQNVEAPPELRFAISSLIRSKVNGVVPNVLKEAKEGLLRAKTYFKTPNGDVYSLPFGSTYLDAANMIHGDFLIGMTGVTLSSGNLSESSVPSKINPFDRMPMAASADSAPVLLFHSSFKVKKPNCRRSLSDVENVKVDPGWRRFCVTQNAQNQIERVLADPFAYFGMKDVPVGENLVSAKGEDYLAKVACIFNTSSLKIREMFPNVSDYDIGKGSFDLFGELTKRIGSKTHWAVEIDVPDEAGHLIEILPYFTKLGLSVRPGKSSSKDGYDKFRFTVESPKLSEDSSKTSFFDTLLKLSYQCSLRILD